MTFIISVCFVPVETSLFFYKEKNLGLTDFYCCTFIVMIEVLNEWLLFLILNNVF